MIQPRHVLDVGRETALEYIEHDGLRMSAALAFYSLFSLAPILILALAVAGALWDTEPARAEVARYATDLVGPRAAEAFHAVLESAGGDGAEFATVAGVLLLLLGSTAVFAELESALNVIWKVEQPSVLRAFARRRLVSAILLVLVGAALMLSVLATTVISFLASFFQAGPFGGEWLWAVVAHAGSLVMFTLLFAAMFKLLPSALIRWHQVWAGAAVTALLFLIGKGLIRGYLEGATLASSYGAAGSGIAFLMWIYYSAIIFYLGAELTSVLARRQRARSPDG